jgi:hypothetical protein
MSDYSNIVERLASVEEELRDLAFDRLKAAVSESDADASDSFAKEERKVLQARRAIAKAIAALEGIGVSRLG